MSNMVYVMMEILFDIIDRLERMGEPSAGIITELLTEDDARDIWEASRKMSITLSDEEEVK